MATTLTRWHPFAELSDMRDRFDRLYEELFGSHTGNGERVAWRPAIDVVRKENELVLKADVPGITADEVKIEVEGDVLTLSGEHSEEKEEKGEDFIRRERRSGSFRRSLTLPEGVDPEAIEATSHDGVLEVRVPLPAEAETRKVEIKPKAA